MTVWVVRAGGKGEQEEAALQGNFVTIHWNELADLAPIQEKQKLTTGYQRANPSQKPSQVSAGVGQVWAFCKEIKPGHLVVLPRLLKSRRTEVAIGKVTGAYCYRNDLGKEIRHTLAVQWFCKGCPRTHFSEEMQKRFGCPPTVYQIRLDNAEMQIRAVLQGQKAPVLQEPAGTGCLSEVLETVRATIVKAVGRGISETQTRGALIDPVLKALGWDFGNLDEVRQEFMDADYALFIERDRKKPIILVEAKALQEDLDKLNHKKQVMGYVGTLGAKWAVLTNGDEYRIYNATGGAMDMKERLFRTVQLSDPDSPAEETLALLSRENIGGLQKTWEDEHDNKRIHKAISTFLRSPKLQHLLVSAVRNELPRLPKKQIEASVSQFCQSELYTLRGSE